MNRELEPLKNCHQTAGKISWLINKYSDDIDAADISFRDGELRGETVKLSKLSLADYYAFVRGLPYKRDSQTYKGEPVEVTSRPYYLLKHRDGGLDCKKKAILMGAFLKKTKRHFQLIGVSNRPDGQIHHIFTRALVNGKFRNVDATYPENTLFEKKPYTNEVVFYDSL